MLHTNTPYCSGSGKSKEGNVFGLLSDACRNDGMNYWCRGHPSIWKVYTSWWLLISCWPNSAKVHSLMYCYCIYSADAFSSRTITGADIWKLLTVLLSTYREGPATTLLRYCFSAVLLDVLTTKCNILFAICFFYW